MIDHFESKDRINSFLRSIFRYKRMLARRSPDELLTMEKAILKDKLESLSIEEVYEAVISWEEYYEETIVDECIKDEQFSKDLDAHLQALN